MARIWTHPWLPLLILTSMLAVPANAARFHVQPGGQRSSGPSIPGNWTAANCYDILADAVLAAAPEDSVLLQETDHLVTEQVDLAVALLTNSRLSDTRRWSTLNFTPEGSLVLPDGQPSLEVRGLQLSGDGSLRSQPALRAMDPGVDLTLTVCSFTGFVSSASGLLGGGALRVSGAGNLTVLGCQFADNICHGRGGGAWLGGGLTAEFRDCSWDDNSALVYADARGGGIMIDARDVLSTVSFFDCLWRSNTSGGTGGAMATLSAAVTMEDCGVHGSHSGVENGWSEGAGLHFRRNAGDHTDPTPVVIRRSEFMDNQGFPDQELSAGDGGAMEINGGNAERMIELLVEDCLFRRNFNLQGAGVYVSRFAEGTVRRCRFYDNIAQYLGGGAFKGGHLYENHGETLTIDSCLFVRNLAGFTVDGQPNDHYCRGGAIACRMYPRVVVRHCTFIDNRVDDPGYHFGDAFAHYFEYGEWEPDMLCTIQNCFFWGDDGGHVQAWSSEGGMAAADHNAALAGELDLGGVAETGTIVLTESPFTSLETGFPLADGPLIDAGLDLMFTVDIDGRSMPMGDGPDVGCYEWHDVTAVGDLPTATIKLAAGPNPFNPRTVLSCRLHAPASVRLVLYDARGHQVRQIWNGPLAAGDHAWTWDGRDQDGRGCGSGVYLAQIQVDDGRMAVAKLTLVR